MNYIDVIRNEVKQYFSIENKIIGSEEIILSPSNNYRIETTLFKQNRQDCNVEVTMVNVFEILSNAQLFSFFVNEGTFFYSWIVKDEIEYLLCAEDLCGGQTVLDLTNIQMSSYTENNDGFIWTQHYLSPDKNTLAVIGCGWGSNYFVKLYDFTNPMRLPLKEKGEIELIDNNEQLIMWMDNVTIKFKNDDASERLVSILKLV